MVDERQRTKQRRQRERRNSERRSDTLGPALAGISASEISGMLAVRDARIEIRCPADVKEEIEGLAGRYGLTVTTYLLRLHELAKSRLLTQEQP